MRHDDLTPMYRQWAAAKRDYPDVLLLFRMGDFYELFDDDARIASEALGLTLTSRKYSGDKRIAMCGVPHHALDRYLRQLVAKGFRAAICDQMEDPRQAKGIVRRQVTRVITPGTLIEEELLEGAEHNFLLSLATVGEKAGIAVVDVSTGDFLVTEVEVNDVSGVPARRDQVPREGDGRQGAEDGGGDLRITTAVQVGGSRESEFAPTGAPSGVETPLAGLAPDRDDRLARVADEIARLQPAEILLPEELMAEPAIQEAAVRAGGAHLTAFVEDELEFRSPEQQLLDFFHVTSLRGFGCEGLRAAQKAAAQALKYVEANRLEALPHFTGLTTYSTEQFMVVDAATRRNLELVASLRDGSREGSLLGLLDKTSTPMGARLLRQWLLQPLLDVFAIQRRLEAVAALAGDGVLADRLRQALRSVRDVERLINRTTAGTANARDLVALRGSLAGLPEVRAALEEASLAGTRPVASAPSSDETTDTTSRTPAANGTAAAHGSGSESRIATAVGMEVGRESESTPAGAAPAGAPGLLAALWHQIDPLPDLTELLSLALADEPPATITEGGIIRDGFSPELDELRDAVSHGREWIARLQDQERARTGIESLKVGFNKVFGYYIEVTKANLRLVPEDYQRKQTLVGAERFITPELKVMEERILGAEEKSQALEYDLFCQVRTQVAAQSERVLSTARAVAQLDVLLSLARVAVEYDYARPEINDTDALEIVDGRHPVVERAAATGLFVPNDTRLDCKHNQLLIVTGPNMAGKSTYLRQVAIICLMAQMGSFVPARRASLGLVDRIFTRVGASDDLATGQSTFMVEMTETANILHNATDRSLIVLDEIGRGTSTFDGLSIAWAVAEFIVSRVGAKTLFATHYHHLNELAAVLPRVQNVRVAVKEQGDDVVFLRKIVPGGTDRSYGIQVARLAGLPAEVIERAREVLHALEQEDLAKQEGIGSRVGPRPEAAKRVAPTVQLTLFEAAPDPALEELRRLEVETMTPVEALVALKRLQDMTRPK